MSIQKGLTRKQREFIKSINRNTEGLTSVSTGVCPGCETCKEEYGIKVKCECGAPEVEGDYCDLCDDSGERAPTMEEFNKQVGSGRAWSEGAFSWQGCDLCGSSLGGTFEPWHGVDSNGEILHGEYACVDCMLYLANGDLPGEN